MDPRKSRKSDDDVVAIIQCYNEKTKAFTVGKKNLTFTTNDVTLIFGLQGGKGAMSLRYSKKPKSAFLRRRFPKDTRLTGLVLKNALVKAMKGKQPTNYKDVAIIVILYLCLTLFFITSENSIWWIFIKYVEPLESMKQYDWPEAITSTLIDSIIALHKTPEKVTGCVIALLVSIISIQICSYHTYKFVCLAKFNYFNFHHSIGYVNMQISLTWKTVTQLISQDVPSGTYKA
ncbi:unnamed protein product [Camellia sinensis]